MAPQPAQMDIMTVGPGGVSAPRGSVTERLLNHGLSALRTNALLRKEEWQLFDTVVVDTAKQRLRAAADLVNAGLVMNLANGMGTTVLQWERISDMEAAEINMDAVARPQKDRVEWEIESIPIPVIHKEFSLNIRTLEASRRNGTPLDTVYAQRATRQVAELVDSTIINGASGLTFGGGTLRGYLDHPQRNTESLPEAWDGSGMTGELRLADVLTLLSSARDDLMFGPYVLYVPAAYETLLDDDYATGTNVSFTLRQRIEAINAISSLRVMDTLAADTLLLVQMTSDVIDLVIGQQPTVIQWETDGGFIQHFKVITIMVPRIKRDFNDRSGIVHMS